MTEENVSRMSPKPGKKASAAAREAEADDGYVTIEQCGVELKIPLKGRIPLAAIDLFYEGDNYGGTRKMIGEEQWNRLIEAGATDGDLDELTGKLKDGTGN